MFKMFLTACTKMAKLQLSKKLNLKDGSFDNRQMHLWPVGREEAAKVQLNKNVLTQGRNFYVLMRKK